MNMNKNIVDQNPVSPTEIIPLARMVFPTKRILLMRGQGGSGKTSIATGMLPKALGYDVVLLVNLSGASPMEGIGYGIPHEAGKGENGVMQYDMAFSAPEIWPILRRYGDKRVLLVLDEWSNWDPTMQSLTRGLFPVHGQPRMIGTHVLANNVDVIMTGNTKQHGSSQSKIEDAPMTERCVVCTLRPDVPAWVTWWESDEARAALGAFVPSFLQWGSTVTAEDGSNDHFAPPIKMPYDGSPHPCPRTWEAVALTEQHRKSDMTAFRQVVYGSVGEQAGNAYLSFLGHADKLPSINKAKKDPKNYNLPQDPAQQYALVNAALVVLQSDMAGQDPGTAIHAGVADWFVDIINNAKDCDGDPMRGDIRAFAGASAVSRGIPVNEHAESHTIFC